MVKSKYSNKKIVILEKNAVTPNGDINLDELTNLGDVTVYDNVPDGKLEDIVKGAEAVICSKAKFTEEVLSKCPELKYIGLWATGYDNIDTTFASKQNITVSNVPGYSTDSVAQHTFALILNLASNIIKYDKSVHEGDWKKSKIFTYFDFPIIELSGKKLGILGYGAIGKAVAKIGEAFGMQPIIHTRTSPKNCPYKVVSFNELLSESDFLTIHCPLTDKTKKIINEDSLSKMKKTAFIINTSRGGTIDEEALAKALCKGTIAGAGIDVLDGEPMRADHPYFDAPNCIITPHIAWASFEARKRLVNIVVDNLKAYIDGKPINNVAKKSVSIYRPELKGSVEAIPSKSHVHRLLIAAALYGTATKITYSGKLSEDITATIKCLQALGAKISVNGSEITVERTNTLTKNTDAQLYCGESGSTLRFLLPVVCALGIDAQFYPEGRLPNRPLSPLREELINHGCSVDSVGTVPFKTSGKLRGGKFEIAGNISSQYITGLLFALPLLEENSEIHIVGKLESRPYVDMTLEVLTHFGVDIKAVSDSLILVGGNKNFRHPDGMLSFRADGDWSNAAFWLTAGAIGNNPVCVTGLRNDSAQGDKAVLDILKRFGATVSVSKSTSYSDDSLCDVTVLPSCLQGIEIDASDIPDLVPILSLAAACANGATKIYNAQRLKLKESDRIATVCDLLGSLGADIQPTEDGLIINGCRTAEKHAEPNNFCLKGGTVNSHNDHRIAMTAAIAATVCSDKLVITDSDAVNKSYPLFWQDYDNIKIN